MPRGLPDGTLWGKGRAISHLYDVAENAARISGYLTPHPEGKWLAREGFDNGIVNWGSASSDPSGEVAATVAYSRVGGVSALLISGDTALDYSYIQKIFPFPVSGKCGFEFAWTCDNAHMYVDIIVRWYYNNRVRRWGVRVDVRGGILYSLNYDLTWTEWHTGVYPEHDSRGWNISKLVIDLDTKAYMRYLLNGVSYPITTVQASAGAGTPGPVAQMDVLVVSKLDASATLYVDEVMVTDSERVL